MKKFYSIITATLLGMLITGCSTTLPSKWDDNESAGAADVYWSIQEIRCDDPLVHRYMDHAYGKINWLYYYTKLKGTEDIHPLVDGMRITIEPLTGKEVGEINPRYCELKRRVLVEQAIIISDTVMGRF